MNNYLVISIGSMISTKPFKIILYICFLLSFGPLLYSIAIRGGSNFIKNYIGMILLSNGFLLLFNFFLLIIIFKFFLRLKIF